MAEVRHIPGMFGYAVSDDGAVIDLNAMRVHPSHLEHGYRRVRMRTRSGTTYEYVHRLVAMAFFGPPPTSKHEVRHLDGTRDNNTVSNLAWGTRSENCLDTVRHGRNPTQSRPECRAVGRRSGYYTHPERYSCGSARYNAKLTEDIVRDARVKRRDGETISDLARLFDVPRSALRRAIEGVTWKHVTQKEMS